MYAFCSAGGLTQVVSMKLISRVTSCSNGDSSGMGSPWSRVFVLREDKSLRTQAEGAALNESAHIEKCQPLEGERPNDCQKLVRSWVRPPCLLWPPRAHGCKAGQGCGGHTGHSGTPGPLCLDQPAAEIERGDGKESGQFPWMGRGVVFLPLTFGTLFGSPSKEKKNEQWPVMLLCKERSSQLIYGATK